MVLVVGKYKDASTPYLSIFVPGCHKNIYRELRPSFTRSEILVNICCLFRQQTQHLLPSWWPGTPKGVLWEFVGKVIFSLFDPKNRFSVFNSPINIAGGRLDILFHFPNDWDKNIEGKIEKIKIDFFAFTKNTLKSAYDPLNLMYS